jgi:hypothetical protein
MKNIVIAYHIYLTGNDSPEMILEQFRLLLNSGLYQACNKLYIGIVNEENQIHSCSDRFDSSVDWIRSFWSFASSKNTLMIPKVEIVVYPENNEIADTLKRVRDYSAQNPDEYVLFFHTKGITHGTQFVEDWRRYMEYFVVENWKDCIQKLDEGYDCCGVMWNVDTNLGIWPHFSGAFWWANTSYINTLDHSYLDNDWKYMREFWIGSNPDVKQFEFHNSGLNDKDAILEGRSHYQLLYPRINYEKL